ncbi:MAG: CaiB/BaiF CoA-transferase family protein [Bacteroidota bacterium]
MLPLQGIKVLEFTHAVMGPTTGLLLAEMGAEVIHIEPITGDYTRELKGFGSGFFDMYSRSKKSLSIDLKQSEGKEIIYRLAADSDVIVENFGPGTFERLGFGYEKMQAINDRLIYCSLKGFLDGPYDKRPAMDEVVQMMGGLAYMTGREGDPHRAGSSIIDITGGMFGYIGILQALYEREKTGKGQFVKASLFETCVFMMGQHMAYSAILGPETKLPPMAGKASPWSVYRPFDTADEEQVFIGIISDKHWQRFCTAFGWLDWADDPRLETNNGRIAQNDWLIPTLVERFASMPKAEIITKCETAGVPFAPISRPEQLFDDPHLNAANALIPTELKDGTQTKLPRLPLQYGKRSAQQLSKTRPPRLGEHTSEVLVSLGYDEAEIQRLLNSNICKGE